MDALRSAQDPKERTEGRRLLLLWLYEKVGAPFRASEAMRTMKIRSTSAAASGHMLASVASWLAVCWPGLAMSAGMKLPKLLEP